MAEDIPEGPLNVRGSYSLRFAVPTGPAEFSTHAAVLGYGPEYAAFEIRFHRPDVPFPIPGPEMKFPDVVDAPCVARVVLAEQTLREFYETIGRQLARREEERRQRASASAEGESSDSAAE